jgi:hypothetical protein
MATLRFLVDDYGVSTNSFNSYGNTAIILAMRATMSAFQRGGAFCPELETGVEVVEYLLCKGADP